MIITIDLERFFPCSRGQLNLLLNAVELDRGHQGDLLKEIMQFLKNKEQELLKQGNTLDAQIFYLCMNEIKEMYGGHYEEI